MRLKSYIAILIFALTSPLGFANFAMPKSYIQQGVLKHEGLKIPLTIYAKSDSINNTIQVDSPIGALCTIKSTGKNLKSLNTAPYIFRESWAKNFVLRDAYYILNVLPRYMKDASQEELNTMLKNGFSIKPKNYDNYEIKFSNFKKVRGKFAPKTVEIKAETYELHLTLKVY